MKLYPAGCGATESVCSTTLPPMSYAPQGDGAFVCPTVLTLPMYWDGRCIPGGKSAGNVVAQSGPACEGHQVGAFPAGAPGVSTVEFGSFGLYVASGCLSALVTSPVAGSSTETFGWSKGP